MKTMFGWSGWLACILASGCLWGADALVVEPGDRELAWRGVARQADAAAPADIHWLPLDSGERLREGSQAQLHPLGASLCFVLSRPDGRSEIVICDPAELEAIAPQVLERVRARHVATWLLWNEPLEGHR